MISPSRSLHPHLTISSSYTLYSFSLVLHLLGSFLFVQPSRALFRNSGKKTHHSDRQKEREERRVFLVQRSSMSALLPRGLHLLLPHKHIVIFFIFFSLFSSSFHPAHDMAGKLLFSSSSLAETCPWGPLFKIILFVSEPSRERDRWINWL